MAPTQAQVVSASTDIHRRLRATTAAPRYFKSFYHKATHHTFNDGGIKFNNPVALANEERKLIWPESRTQDPDILLSIGTAFDSSAARQPLEPGPQAKLGLKGFAMKMFKIAIDTLQDVLDCERSWVTFLESVGIQNDDAERRRKYWRLNPDLNQIRTETNSIGLAVTLPKLDEVDEMDVLVSHTLCIFRGSPKLRDVKATLVSSLFYFEWCNMEEAGDGGPIAVEGIFRCCNKYSV